MRMEEEEETIACWSHRGCEGVPGVSRPMEEECPHNRQDCYSPCPAECNYTVCSRPWHRTTSDIDLILDTTVDRYAAVKRNCFMCEHFLKYGPRVKAQENDGCVMPDAATPEESGGVTIHLF